MVKCTKKEPALVYSLRQEFLTEYVYLSGFLAAFWSSLALCPTELIKCRLQAMRESNLEKGLEPPRIGPFGLTRQILNTEGIGGLFHGLRPTFMREMPGYFCFFFAYEFTREMFVKEGKKNILL